MVYLGGRRGAVVPSGEGGARGRSNKSNSLINARGGGIDRGGGGGGGAGAGGSGGGGGEGVVDKGREDW